MKKVSHLITLAWLVSCSYFAMAQGYDCNALAGYSHSSPMPSINRGQLVYSANNVYSCQEPGWCSTLSPDYYEPGIGSAWGQAWVLETACTLDKANVDCSTLSNWVSGRLYSAGERITLNGRRYSSTIHFNNSNPAAGNGDWVVNGACIGSAQDLFFSEYIEGSYFNKAIEIYNPTNRTINLSSYAIKIFFNGKNTINNNSNLYLRGTLAPGDVFVVINPNASSEMWNVADQIESMLNFNGNDAVVLTKNDAHIDSIGQVGVNPGIGWTNNNVATFNQTLRRKSGVSRGDADGTNAYFPDIEWNTFAQDDISHLGQY